MRSKFRSRFKWAKGVHRTARKSYHKRHQKMIRRAFKGNPRFA